MTPTPDEAVEALAESTMFFLFHPSRAQSNVVFSLHKWKMRGNRVVEVEDIYEYSVHSYYPVGGWLQPVIPPQLVDYIERLQAEGFQTNVPWGWCDGGWA